MLIKQQFYAINIDLPDWKHEISDQVFLFCTNVNNNIFSGYN